MNRSMPILRSLAVATLLFCVTISACKKAGQNTKYDMVNAQLASAFHFQLGTYWIYKDSVSGETDSAYVAAYTVLYDQGYSCSGLIRPGTTREEINITINFVCTDTVAGTPARSAQESWTLFAQDSVMDIIVSNARDTIESEQNRMAMAVYPFVIGYVPIAYGCAIPAFADSASIVSIFPSYTVNGQTYSNTALSVHALWRTDPYNANSTYNDSYYLAPNTGFVKVVFNHPSESIRRVLELQRSNIVQ